MSIDINLSVIAIQGRKGSQRSSDSERSDTGNGYSLQQRNPSKPDSKGISVEQKNMALKHSGIGTRDE